MTQELSPDVTYTYMPEGIHLITVYGGTRETVDLIFDHLEHVTQQTPHGTLIPLILDILPAKSMPPVAHVIRKSREYQRKFQDPPTTRFALIHRMSTWTSIIKGLAEMSAHYNRGRNKFHFFTSEQQQEAVAWLVGEAKTHQHNVK